MADNNDRDRGRGVGRRRRPRGGPPGISRKDRDYDDNPTPVPTSRPTIILAKHEDRDRDRDSTNQMMVGSRGNTSSTSTSPAPLARQPEKQMMVLKPTDESSRTLTPGHGSGVSLPSIPVGTMQGETPPQPTFLQRTIEGPSKLHGAHELSKCVKLIDEHNQWLEAASDCLMEHGDYLVVGVIGLQGSGKSTLLSLLAGNTETDSQRNYVFPVQTREQREECSHMTKGIDLHVTSSRTIFLDSQPLLSASVLDQLIHTEKKIPPEYTTAENYAEIQCLQHMSFLMTVCNVLLVVQDWFTDMSLLRFLQTAEMLKPPIQQPSGHDGSTSVDDQPDFFPHLVFVQNKAGRDDFSVDNFTAMQKTLSSVFNSTKIKMKGDVTMTTGRQLFGLNPSFVKSDLNLFILPHMDKRKRQQDTVLTQLPEYRGYPSFQTLINSLRGQVLSMPRESHTQSTRTEKNWFHFAARTWDSIKKSTLIGEYNRLLP